ncbi:arogenate dehydratase 3, chloroplastic-like [Cajanus cajan]|uniref:arogenate dehydratase 3, chloroplastic-like n=1 Tax=Cajanus cajan TaxID=3821 RepID=UPI0010FB2E27|nr:arogenate dehydratase 3, chloroplastic-like [Cajanus cajan]
MPFAIHFSGPLTSTQLSASVSDGSRLRVAYQGVRGAYSESAAQKAYPNCEAVPCEQFDTAFEVKFRCPFLLITLKIKCLFGLAALIHDFMNLTQKQVILTYCFHVFYVS